ncbi:zinc transporter 7 [Phtheirospermum japonicum]|uniref:Zinc transporter 7 n=1 Tax=Phtheirospermum japonicum TaxID=374723 RepID=A0A830DF21_9LAMI|nr:zinc transporter 7 [Phtheirospermum japonicum]
MQLRRRERVPDNGEALKLKLIAVASILVTSMIGVCLPIFSRSVPSLQRTRICSCLVKAFASGVYTGDGLHARAAGLVRRPDVGMVCRRSRGGGSRSPRSSPCCRLWSR